MPDKGGKMSQLIPTEFQEQVVLVAYLDYLVKTKKILAFTAIPQNMWTRSIQQKIKAKREGVRPGFPDLVIVTHHEVIFLEMKRVKGGRVRPEQLKWLAKLDGKQTVTAVAMGADDAIRYVEAKIQNKKGEK